MLPALIKLRALGIPLVYTHTLLPEARRRPWFKRAAWRRYVTAPMQLVDVVVVSSAVMRDGLRDLGVTTELRVIPNGVDTTRFHPPATEADRLRIRKKLGIPPEAKVALFLGPIVPRKGIDLLAGAWKRLAARWPELHLVLAGPRLDLTVPTNSHFHNLVTALMKASGAEDRVHFTGMVEEPETYMRAADLFVFPSRREGMPNVVPEAMATGLPVVMTPFQGLPSEFGLAGQHYLLAEFDADSLAGQIDLLLADSDLRRTMGAAAREWVQSRLDVASSIQRYASLYGELATRANLRELAR
jgi:glycosyltransferase involved in cell wall biosynthesis